MDWAQPVSAGHVLHFIYILLHFAYLQDGNESNYSYSEPLSDTDNYIDNKRAAKLEAEKHAYIQLEKAQVSTVRLLISISIESVWPPYTFYTFGHCLPHSHLFTLLL